MISKMTRTFVGLIFISITIFSCKKSVENFTSPQLSEYYPMEVGKYITYDLDSTVYYVNFGQQASVIHYQGQDRCDAEITDNNGRPAYRILRFIREDASQQWTPNNTFMVVPTTNSVEVIENNMRYLKLELPVKQDFSWKGNSFIDTYSNYTDVKYLEDWDYIYDSVGIPLTLNSLSFDSTIKVMQRDEFLGQDPSISGTQYAENKLQPGKTGCHYHGTY